MARLDTIEDKHTNMTDSFPVRIMAATELGQIRGKRQVLSKFLTKCQVWIFWMMEYGAPGT